MGEALDQPGQNDAQQPPQYNLHGPPAAGPPPPQAKTKGRKYSFLDAQSRREHPIVTALVANAIAGRNAFHLIDALDQREAQKQQTLAMAGTKRFEYGRTLAMKMGDVAAMEPDDPLRPQFERAFDAIRSSEPPPGYTWDPRTRKMYKQPEEKSANIAGEGGIYEVTGAPGSKTARPIPIQEPGAPATTAGPPAVPTQAQGGGTTTPTAQVGAFDRMLADPKVPEATKVYIRRQLSGGGQAIPAQPQARSRFLQPKPPAPKEPGTELKQNRRGEWVPVSKATGINPMTQEPVQGPGPANLIGMGIRIKNAKVALDNMTRTYEAAQQHNLGAKTVGAFASDIAHTFPSLRGVAEAYAPGGTGAIMHENNRHAVATAFAGPFSGTNRIQGVIDQLLNVIPHFTDNREVYDNFTQQMNIFMDNASRLPWDTDPEGARDQYEQMVYQLQPAPTANGPSNRKSPADILREVQGGRTRP